MAKDMTLAWRGPRVGDGGGLGGGGRLGGGVGFGGGVGLRGGVGLNGEDNGLGGGLHVELVED